jgi:hypothetical protein
MSRAGPSAQTRSRRTSRTQRGAPAADERTDHGEAAVLKLAGLLDLELLRRERAREAERVEDPSRAALGVVRLDALGRDLEDGDVAHNLLLALRRHVRPRLWWREWGG